MVIMWILVVALAFCFPVWMCTVQYSTVLATDHGIHRMWSYMYTHPCTHVSIILLLVGGVSIWFILTLAFTGDCPSVVGHLLGVFSLFFPFFFFFPLFVAS